MENHYVLFKNKFISILEKGSYFTKHELEVFWALVSCLIGSSYFSFSGVSARFGKKIGRNSCAKVLKKYSYVQEKLYTILLDEVLTTIDKNTKFFVIVDDTLVKKTGQTIFSCFKWYDHASGKYIRALGIVTLVIVVANEPVFFLPWLLTTTKMKHKTSTSKQQQQGVKNKAAQYMISFIVTYLLGKNISTSQIVVEADSWYSTKKMRTFLHDLGVNYRVDSKSSYTVQLPDFEAITKAKQQIRGRKRKKFVKYVKIGQFLGDKLDWKSFFDPLSNTRVKYNIAQVTLKSGGQALVYAYWSKKYKYPKYILTEVKRKKRVGIKTIYYQYQLRWIIEVCHKHLKQHFGLSKNQSRDPWVVQGFVGLIGLIFSIWSILHYTNKTNDDSSIACPQWAKEFHELQIKQKM